MIKGKFRQLISDNNNNKGFTLVELLVCIGILAAVAIPIVQSFSAASISNSKAQSLQNATSLAEDIMEEIKSSEIKDLETAYGAKASTVDEATFWATPEVNRPAFYATDGLYRYHDSSESNDSKDFFVLVKKDVTSTQGETFDVVAAISSDKYKSPSETPDASDANSIKLPKITEVDTSKQVALKDELNKYDGGAAGEIAALYATAPLDATIAASGTKTITITIDDGDYSGGVASKVTVNAKATYTDGTKTVSHILFTGTYTENPGVLNQPNVYLFFTPMNEVKDRYGNSINSFANEQIIIDDRTSGVYPAGTKDKITDDVLDGLNVRHDVYLIMQKGSYDLTSHGVTVTVKQSGSSMTAPGALGTRDGVLCADFDGTTMQINGKNGDRFFSNLITSATETEEYKKYGKIYETKEKNRIYQINVTLTKNGKSTVYAELESTKDADVTPTPTPSATPTT